MCLALLPSSPARLLAIINVKVKYRSREVFKLEITRSLDVQGCVCNTSQLFQNLSETVAWWGWIIWFEHEKGREKVMKIMQRFFFFWHLPLPPWLSSFPVFLLLFPLPLSLHPRPPHQSPCTHRRTASALLCEQCIQPSVLLLYSYQDTPEFMWSWGWAPFYGPHRGGGVIGLLWSGNYHPCPEASRLRSSFHFLSVPPSITPSDKSQLYLKYFFPSAKHRENIVLFPRERAGAPAGMGVQYLYSFVTQSIWISKHFKSFVPKKGLLCGSWHWRK